MQYPERIYEGFSGYSTRLCYTGPAGYPDRLENPTVHKNQAYPHRSAPLKSNVGIQDLSLDSIMFVRTLSHADDAPIRDPLDA
jgi:hypothetical protein